MVYYYSLILVALAAVLLSCESEPYQQGERLYLSLCSNCHMDDGSGLVGNIPPLAQADYLRDHQAEIACIIRYGQNATIVVNGQTYQNPMPGQPGLTDFQIANIINYINHAWGNDYGFVKVADLRQQLTTCPTDTIR